MNVTSLVAQREVCQSYIKCQAHRKWTELPQSYDDGGYSGGTLERPALRRLISDIEAGRVDVIIIYKIDRLTRSLLDFVRFIEVLERYEVSFVSVTQAFDTSDSMGRLILNILLTFAQFERELMSDRVRDKKAAMQRRGYFAGGLPPFGYLVDSGGRLCIDDERAPIVRELFNRYPHTSSVRVLVDDLRRRGCVTRRFASKVGRQRGGQPITTATVRHILENPVYTGYIVHRGEWIEAEIDPLVTRDTWDLVQRERLKRIPKRDPETDFLIGILYDDHGRRMRMLKAGPGRTNHARYYRSEAAGWSRGTEHKTDLVNADQVEGLVRAVLTGFLRDRRLLKDAVLSDNLYSDDICKLLRRGNVAARRLECMDASQFRQALVSLLPRAEVTKGELRLLVSCAELKRFLSWDGTGRFAKSPAQSKPEAQRCYVVPSPACLIRGHHRHSLPVAPRDDSSRAPRPDLVALIKKAAEARDAVFANRDKSVADLASERRMTESHFSRLVRVNYLAPDIQTAILDGVEPAGLCRQKILNAAMLLDWKQQREVLGFAVS
jgi:DNA invertase Pin-like site-specific DNA recombinase